MSKQSHAQNEPDQMLVQTYDEMVNGWLPDAEAAIAAFGQQWFGVSRLQRAMRIGYSKAQMILERLVERGRLKQDAWRYKSAAGG